MATILVVDDEMFIAELLRDVLEEEGYRVLVAHDGRQALGLAREERPDLVLSDVMMPVMDGAELAETLRQDPTMAETQVILMSAGTAPDVKRTWAVAFLGKPFVIEHVLTLIGQYVVA